MQIKDYAIKFYLKPDGDLEIIIESPEEPKLEQYITKMATLLYLVNSGKLAGECVKVLQDGNKQITSQLLAAWKDMISASATDDSPLIKPSEVFKGEST